MSVAVLTFDNLSRDTADTYLPDQLSEEITARLAQIDRLQMKGRSAVRRAQRSLEGNYRGLSVALAVRYLVEGAVQHAGQRLRVSVRLIRAEDGFRVWGDISDRAAGDVLALQEDIASNVVTGIAGTLAPGERGLLARRATTDPAAYDHVLRGNYQLARRTPAGLARAITEYEQAARMDPAYSDAFARQASALGILIWWGWDYRDLPADSLLARGFAADDRALALDSASSDAWMARGQLLTYRYPHTFDGSLAAYRHALTLNPRNAEAWHQYGATVRLLGQDSAALAAYQQALALEPGRAITLHDVALATLLSSGYADAEPWLDSTLSADPEFALGYYRRAAVRLGLGRRAEAREDAETAQRLWTSTWPEADAAARALAEWASGDTAAALARGRQLAQTVSSRPRREGRAALLVATVLAILDDREQALSVLQQVRPRGAAFWYALRFPWFASVRADPRFQRLAEEARPR